MSTSTASTPGVTIDSIEACAKFGLDGAYYLINVKLTIQTGEQLMVEFNTRRTGLAVDGLSLWGVSFDGEPVFFQADTNGSLYFKNLYPCGWRDRPLADCLADCLRAIKDYAIKHYSEEYKGIPEEGLEFIALPSLFGTKAHWPYQYRVWHWSWPWPVGYWELVTERVNFKTYLAQQRKFFHQ